MVNVDGAFRTDDMALATVLSSHGYQYVIERLNRQHAMWVFEANGNDGFHDLISCYEEKKIKVEPRSFILRYTQMRGEVKEFMSGAARQRPRSAPATT